MSGASRRDSGKILRKKTDVAEAGQRSDDDGDDELETIEKTANVTDEVQRCVDSALLFHFVRTHLESELVHCVHLALDVFSVWAKLKGVPFLRDVWGEKVYQVFARAQRILRDNVLGRDSDFVVQFLPYGADPVLDDLFIAKLVRGVALLIEVEHERVGIDK